MSNIIIAAFIIFVIFFIAAAVGAGSSRNNVTVYFKTPAGKTVRKGEGRSVGEAMLDGFRNLYDSLSPGSYPDTIQSRLNTMEMDLAKYRSSMRQQEIDGCEEYICRTRKLLEEKTAGREAHRVFVAEQRRLMTDALRYEILRRDGFRCQICGATAQDGYKLHVDHIIPVSRGGRTEPGNLRTLCERCNMGKGDRIEVVSLDTGARSKRSGEKTSADSPAFPPEQPAPAAEPEAESVPTAQIRDEAPVSSADFIDTEITGNGWKILFDSETARTRVMFDEEPTDAARSAVENAGFYYSPYMNSYNKKLTKKAHRAALALADQLRELYGTEK